ncbi:hypothetical protein M758_10G170600 [Ceratodon purpureus]|nr:hypothetical protein M758_10G170600 [Ceratodon purpureus]
MQNFVGFCMITGINVGASALSFAGTLFIVMCYILFKDLRMFPFKLIFYLSLCENASDSVICVHQNVS